VSHVARVDPLITVDVWRSPMIRLRRLSVVASIVALSAALLPISYGPNAAIAQADAKSAEKWLVDRALTVSPQPEPVPAFQYRLFPLIWDRKDGNAVPIYLRLVHEQNDASRRRWAEEPAKWNDLPLDRMPVAEAKEFLKDYRYMLRQLELGARRKTAEWEYTFDQGSVVEMLLPDVQSIRNYIPLLILKARVEMAEGDYTAAARTFETGFAFCRHVSEAATIITALVGVAGCDRFAERVLEWVERPGAPNLYWSLTALPRPLIDMRKGMEFEQRLMEMEFPDLTDLDRPRTAEQWDALLRAIRTTHQRLMAHDKKTLAAGLTAADPASASPDLPVAKAYLIERMGHDAVAAMPPAQVLVLHLVGFTREYRDDYFKAMYLPYPQARPVAAAAEALFKAAPGTEAKRFGELLFPAMLKVLTAQVRMERKIAALRVIEALRLHAAAHGGQLPDNLGDVTIVPIPSDPGTGQPFEYKRDGATAMLTSHIPGEPLATTGLRYRVTVKSK
jgi:hypothetical protein